MKNFFFKVATVLFACLGGVSCGKPMFGPDSDYLATIDPDSVQSVSRTDLDQLARTFAALPLDRNHLSEVYRAVSGSSRNGYDEEYTMRQLVCAPGCGVGDPDTKALKSGGTLRDLIAASDDAEDFLKELEKSSAQIYWPYSEDWDGEEYPIITFDPGYDSGYNYGYALTPREDGSLQVDSVYVDESVAASRPVWVINRNEDASYTPLILTETKSADVRPSGGNRMLIMKDFTMLRHYDSWFQGASEFFIKCGSVNGFSAATEAELKLYIPSVTDFMVVVPRKMIGKKVDFNAIILTNFTNQLDNLAFLITEDDGGTQTNWKCSATVKINSRSYGFDVNIPYNEKDDIVWRGQLSASFFQSEDVVSGRFGDVVVSFALE